MCYICGQTPCHPQCPNAEGRRVVCHCSQCYNEIYEGEGFYIINDEEWCEECVTDCRATAEADEPECDYE